MVVRPRINIIEIFSGQRRFRLAGDNFRDRLLTRSKQAVAGATRVSSKKFQRDASTSGNVREYEIAFSANEQRYPFLFSFFYLFFITRRCILSISVEYDDLWSKTYKAFRPISLRVSRFFSFFGRS